MAHFVVDEAVNTVFRMITGGSAGSRMNYGLAAFAPPARLSMNCVRWFNEFVDVARAPGLRISPQMEMTISRRRRFRALADRGDDRDGGLAAAGDHVEVGHVRWSSRLTTGHTERADRRRASGRSSVSPCRAGTTSLAAVRSAGGDVEGDGCIRRRPAMQSIRRSVGGGGTSSRRARFRPSHWDSTPTRAPTVSGPHCAGS